MFTGRRFDYETGLYYYRARYYNPYIGRFLQTDPIGYGAGMNLYAYCGNNPTNFLDPSGTTSWSMDEKGFGAGFLIRFTIYNDYGVELRHYDACGVADGCNWLTRQDDIFTDEWFSGQEGWKLSSEDKFTFFNLQAVNKLGGGFDLGALEDYGVTISRKESLGYGLSGYSYDPVSKVITWSENAEGVTGLGSILQPSWYVMRDGPVAFLAHELQHAEDNLNGMDSSYHPHRYVSEKNAIRTQNIVAMALIDLAPDAYGIGSWRIWPLVKWKKEHWLRPFGFSIDEEPTLPWGN